jgi:hypothetical protein
MPAVTRTGREADLLPPTSDDGKNQWSYTSTPPPGTCLMECTRASFTTQHRCIAVLPIATVWITFTCGKMWQRPAVRSFLTRGVCRRFATVGSIEANPDIAMQLDESKDWGFDGNCECACGCGTFTKCASRRASCSVWKPSKKQMQYRLKAAYVLTDTADCF